MTVKQIFLLSVVVPTFNERENVKELVWRLDAALKGISWEVVFVDDNSPDGTADTIFRIAEKDTRVRCIKRIGVTGLASACIEGIAASTAPYVAIMDADLQHDEKILPEMLNALRYENMDIVIGSRYILGGGLGQWSKSRVFVSYIATKLGRLILRADISDPMSGFFAMPRDLFEEIKNRISGIGFKILLDIFASSPRSLRFKEIPYEFSKRYAGKSKMGLQSVLDYLMLLANKTGHRFFHQDRQIPRKERETENWHYCSSAAPGLANPAKKTWV